MSAYKLIIVLGLLVMTGCTSEQADVEYPVNDAAAQEYYTTTLKQVIDNKCISCHIYHIEGNNRYDTYEKTKSNIVQMVSRISSTSNTVMPPADAVQLTQEESESFQTFLALLSVNEEEVPAARIQIEWTAYKYPDYDNRAGVSGTFDEISYELNENAIAPIDLLDNAKVTVNTSSVNVGNESERTTNVGTFFSAFTPDIIGDVISYDNNEVTILFEMNGITATETFDVVVNEDSLVLSGSIPDMNIFDWQLGYDALNSVCGDYHENKVWEDIDVTIVILTNQ